MNLTTQLPCLGRARKFVAGLFLLASAAFAQSPSTGSIQGRVLNATNGSYVTNARVTVEGSTAQAFTDASGQFRIDGVPAGQTKVHVFYTGLPEQVQQVAVQSGQPTVLDVSLGDGSGTSSGQVVKLDAFTVASRREMDSA